MLTKKISMKLSGKAFLMIIFYSHKKKKVFNLSLENVVLDRP